MKVIKPEPIASIRAAAEIRTAILDGSLRPGARVIQDALAAKLGVSREPVRRALVILEQEGLVHNGVGRRAVIAPIDPEFVSATYEFREIVEAYVAGRAAERAVDVEPLREIVALGRKAVKTSIVRDLIELDLRFHNELYRASGNCVVVEVMRAQWSHIRRAMMLTLTAEEYRARAWVEHETILDAIAARDSDRARALASAHARNACGFIAVNLDKMIKREQAGRL
jgi:DNA-binding GntR family transcriptional regulator